MAQFSKQLIVKCFIQGYQSKGVMLQNVVGNQIWIAFVIFLSECCSTLCWSQIQNPNGEKVQGVWILLKKIWVAKPGKLSELMENIVEMVCVQFLLLPSSRWDCEHLPSCEQEMLMWLCNYAAAHHSCSLASLITCMLVLDLLNRSVNQTWMCCLFVACRENVSAGCSF